MSQKSIGLSRMQRRRRRRKEGVDESPEAGEVIGDTTSSMDLAFTSQ